MAEERTYTEKELEEMANLLLADEEPAPEAKPKKKAAGPKRGRNAVADKRKAPKTGSNRRQGAKKKQ